MICLVIYMTNVVGRGHESVYVYYLPTFETYRQNYYFPCKIGYSRHDAVERVEQQIKTALPERPEIGLIIKTDDGYLLEQALHAILKLKHRQVDDAPGKEWFLTSPDEVNILAQAIRAY